MTLTPIADTDDQNPLSQENCYLWQPVIDHGHQ